MSVELRPMRLCDIAAVMPVETELFGAEAWTEGMLWSELAQPDSRYFVVAVDGADIVGYAGLCAYDTEAFIQTIGVLPGWQGRGVGTALLEALLAEADRRGVPRVILEVRSDNDTAQRLYARHGFARIGLRRGYYQPSGADAVVMARG